MEGLYYKTFLIASNICLGGNKCVLYIGNENGSGFHYYSYPMLPKIFRQICYLEIVSGLIGEYVLWEKGHWF